MGTAASRVDVCADRSCRFDLAQAGLEVTVALQNTLESLPSAAADRIGVSIGCLIRNGLRHSREGEAHRLPVAEVPGLQLLDGNAVDQLPGSMTCPRARSQPSRGSRLFETILQCHAVVIVPIDHHDDAPVVGQPGRVTAQPILQLAEQVGLSLNLERAVDRFEQYAGY